MSSKTIFLAIISLLLIASASSAPLPEYFAINYETKQCGRYWGGDEYVTYDLPPGRNSYEYQYSNGYFSVETAVGTCKVAGSTYSSFIEACCAQLGYTYVSDNVGVFRLTPENIASQKAVKDYVAQAEAQARAKTIQTIVFYIIVSIVVILPITIIMRWLYQNRKH